MKVREVVIAEYKCAYLTEDGTPYIISWVNGIGNKAIPFPGNHKFIAADGGQYWMLFLKENGDVYTYQGGPLSLKHLQYDSTGKPFKAVAIECYFQAYFAIGEDGAVYGMGRNHYKFLGADTNLTLSKWTKLPNQPSVRFKTLTKGGATGSGQLVALTESGEVYTLKDNSTSWSKKLLPSPVQKVSASTNGFYVALIDGLPYGWGQRKYLGGVTGIITNYEALSGYWNLGEHKIIDIALNDNTTHFILEDNSLWGLGDNAQGEVGVGWELVNRKELYKGAWYVWNWINAVQPNYQSLAFISTPHQVAPDKKFSRVWGGGYYSYYKYAQDIDGNIYAWGRNKGGVIPNGVGISNESALPNAIDVLKPTLVDVFGSSTPAPSIFVPGTAFAGTDQLVVIKEVSTTLSGIATAGRSNNFSYKIERYEWKKISGPECVIESPNSAVTNVSKMTEGQYAFEFTVTDNNTATYTDIVTVTVSR